MPPKEDESVPIFHDGKVGVNFGALGLSRVEIISCGPWYLCCTPFLDMHCGRKSLCVFVPSWQTGFRVFVPSWQEINSAYVAKILLCLCAFVAKKVFVSF
jgi:hypothetical protein